MASPVEKPQAEPCNFFLLPSSASTDPPDLVDIADRIQVIHQDARALNQLIQSHELDRAFSKTSVIGDASLSNMANLAGNINQALDQLLRSGLLAGLSTHETHPASGSRPRIKKHAGTVKRCYSCGVTNAPRWRGGRSDPYHLCNFCDLVKAKKYSRKPASVGSLERR